MKILHLGRFLDDDFGGLERSVVLLLDEICDRATVENLVVSRRERRATTEELYQGRWKVYRAPGWGVVASTAISPVFPLLLNRLYRKERYDIVHLHFPDPLSCLSALTLPRSARFVVSWHGDIVRQKHLLRLYRPWANRLLRRADAVVAATPSHFTDSTQMDCVPEDRRHVIPYGMRASDLALTGEETRRLKTERRKFGGRFVLFAVGRHVYYKGFQYLLQTMQRLPDAVLLLGGEGPLTGELMALRDRLSLGDRVVFLGRMSEADLRLHYHLCDVYCMSSVERSEAFGLVQIEAMSCRKPVVCFDLHNGVTYVNRHMETGLVVPLREVEAFARAIQLLQGDRRLAGRLGKAGQARVEREFTIQVMGARMLELYGRVLAAPPVGRLPHM